MKKNQKKMTINYARGLIETDGCFMLDFVPSGRVKPWFKFSQKSNTNLIPLLSEFLNEQGILYKTKNYEDNDKTKGRAPELVITGINQLRKLVELLDSSNPPFTGVKLRDFLILKDVLENSENKRSFATLIGLKKSLHKRNRNEPDVLRGGAKTRRELEERFGVNLNESYAESEDILRRIDENYSNIISELERQMEKGELQVSPEYICGLVDGDGSFGQSFWQAHWTDRFRQEHYYLKWIMSLYLTMEINSFFTLKVFGYALGSEKWKTIKKPKRASAARISFIDIPSLRNFLKIHKNFPILGDFRSRQFSLVERFFQLKDENKLRSFEEVSRFVAQIYSVQSKKGRKRAKSLEECLEIVTRVFTQK